MADPVTWASAKRFVGTAVEVTQGTAVTPITFTHLLSTFDPEDKFAWLDDEAARGAMVETYGRIQGGGNAEHSLGGPMFVDGLGVWLKNILGDLTTTVATPNSHAFSVLNSGSAQPAALTVADYQGPPASTQTRLWPGVCLSELTLKGNAASSLVEWSGKGVGWLSSVAGATPTAAPTAEPPMAAWRTAIGIGGVASGGTQVKVIDEWEFTITRAVSVEFTAQNSQSPFYIQRGPVGMNGSFHFSKPADEVAAITPLLSNSQPQVQILLSNGGAAGALRTLTIDMAKTAWDTSKINRGDEAVGYDTTWKAIANTTNVGASGGYSPGKVTLQNTVASY
jgi:hypothetical protein